VALATVCDTTRERSLYCSVGSIGNGPWPNRGETNYYARLVATESEFVSYAQNMEDVVLGRLVSLVPRGRFIDVGAGHPILENVTYALYLHGWRGINVEPMQIEVELLRTVRPDDETVQVAVGAAMGSVTLFEAPEFSNRGATTSKADRAARYAAADGVPFVAFESPMVTLSSLLAKFEPGGVHAVKVDVEGMEFDVLTGAELEKHRPWVLIVESTEPNDPTSTAHVWEHIVLDAGYRCVLFDGLNRFYVRADLDDVAELLSVPVNVFDRWVPAIALDLLASNAEIKSANAEIKSLKSEMELLRGSFREAQEYAQALQNVLADLRAANEKKSRPFGRVKRHH